MSNRDQRDHIWIIKTETYTENVRISMTNRDRDCKGLCLNEETKSKTENDWQNCDQHWKDASLNDKTETETENV